jgi:tetratricopeptide (TPR) repeat protein
MLRPCYTALVNPRSALGSFVAVAGLVVAACSQVKPFESTDYIRSEIIKQGGPELAKKSEIPFALDDNIRQAFKKYSRLASTEEVRTEQVLDFIFGHLSLSYQLVPTRDAAATFRDRKGNCLSFVNLFVGVAREAGLNPFYVEVTDAQTWNHRGGLVVSQGHIVGGMYLRGALKTFDFIPYSPKVYRAFKPIDDLTAIAHYYNNLGAEALLAGNMEEAVRLTRIAIELAPHFANALNNIGVCSMRSGDSAKALEYYQQAAAVAPLNTMIMTNILHVYQQQGRTEEASALEKKVEEANTGNPFFFVYMGDMALARNDHAKAMDYMVRALRLDDQLPEVHLGLVRAYLAGGDLERARHFLERALKLDAHDPEAQKYVKMLAADHS